MAVSFSKDEASTQWRATAGILLGSVLVSFSPFFVEFSGLDAFANAFYRLAIGGSILFLIALFRKEALPNKQTLGLCLLAALTIALDLITYNQAILYIGSGLSSVLANLEIVFLVLIGTLFFKETLPPMFLWMSALIGLGVCFLVQPYWFDLQMKNALGIALGLGASLVYAIYLILVKWIGSKTNVSTISMLATIFLFASGILALCIAFVPSATFAIHEPRGVLCVACNGIVGQVLGWLLISKGIKNVSLALSGLLMLTQPALTFILDGLFLGRNTASVQLLGCAILFAAVYATMQLEKRARVTG
jgi:drug/metabolite transporter (DMT)-like permease